MRKPKALTSIPLASLNVAQHHSPRPWWTCAICARRFHWASTYPYNRVSKEIAFQKHVTWQSLTASEPKPEKEALTRALIYWCFPAGQSTVSNIGYTLLGTWVWTTHAFWEADCSQVRKPSGASGTSFMGGPKKAGSDPPAPPLPESGMLVARLGPAARHPHDLATCLLGRTLWHIQLGASQKQGVAFKREDKGNLPEEG